MNSFLGPQCPRQLGQGSGFSLVSHPSREYHPHMVRIIFDDATMSDHIARFIKIWGQDGSGIRDAIQGYSEDEPIPDLSIDSTFDRKRECIVRLFKWHQVGYLVGGYQGEA